MDSGRLSPVPEGPSEVPDPSGEVTAETSANLARRLDEFAEGLDEREIEILKGLLVSSMNPLERLRFLDQSELLTPREWEALRGSPGL